MQKRHDADALRIGVAQFRPAWLQKGATATRIVDSIAQASVSLIDLLVFPEACLSGYPFWICRTNGAAFEDARQRRAYGQFLDAAVEIDSVEVKRIVEASRDAGVSVCVGINERGARVARGSIFCTALTIEKDKGLVAAHRKLMPTHDERLCWAQGDARDLRPHPIGPALVGVLNCWENWMPLARYTLYRGGEDIHVSLWPGNPAVSRDIARFTALEGRVWSVACSGVLSMADVPSDFEFHADFLQQGVDDIFSGGSMITDPRGTIVVSATDGVEGIIHTDIALAAVREARHSFDPSGHYARPDIFSLGVARGRVEDDA